jgi:hypothetical protein
MTSEQWSLDRTLKELGEPEERGNRDPAKATVLIYLLGTKPPRFFGSGFYLLISFDESGRLETARASAQ